MSSDNRAARLALLAALEDESAAISLALQEPVVKIDAASASG